MTKIVINTMQLNFPYYLNSELTMILLLRLTKYETKICLT